MSVRSHTRAALVRVLPLALVALANCGRGVPQELSEIPHAAIERFEPSVQEQFRSALDDLERVNASPNPSARDLANAHGALGMLYHAYAIDDAAEACYRNAETLAPKDSRWPYLLGHVVARAGRTSDAAAAFERALRLAPADVPTLVALAELHLQSGAMDAAEPLIRKAAAGGGVRALVLAGRLAAARGLHADAIGAFEEALRLAPEANEIHYALGQAYRSVGKLDLARDHLARMGKHRAPLADPALDAVTALARGAATHQKRGTTYFQGGDHRRALEEFRRAAEIEPEDAMTRLNLGSTLVLLGDLEGGRAQFEKSLALDAGQSLAHFNLGTIAARQGRDPDAINHYRSALALDPRLAKAHFNLANALRRQGNDVEAAEHYRSVNDLEPGNGTARLGEIQCLVALGHWEAAIARLEDALGAVPEDKGVRDAAVRLFAAAPRDRLRNGPRAREIAEKLVREEPSLPHAVGLAMAAAETGDFPTAIAWQDRAIEAARSAGRPDLLPALVADRSGYAAGRASRTPWPQERPATPANN